MKQAVTIARYELSRLVKNRWLHAFTGIFAAINLIILLVSARINGSLEAGFSRFSASVINFLLIFVPLMSLIVSSQSVAGDKNDKLVSLIRTYPVEASRYVLGKYLGLLASLAGSVVAGGGIALLAIVILAKQENMNSMAIPALLSFFLLSVFVSWGVFIGSRTRSRLTATVAGLIVWVFIVFIYELVIWFVIPGIGFFLQKPALVGLMILNPVEFYRICAVFLRRQGAIFGADFYYWQESFNTAEGYATATILSIVYSMVPLFFASRSIKKGRA